MRFVKTKKGAKYFITEENWKKLDGSEECGNLHDKFILEEDNPMCFVTSEIINGYPKIISTSKVTDIRPPLPIEITLGVNEGYTNYYFESKTDYRACEEEARLRQELSKFPIDIYGFYDFKVKRAKTGIYTTTWRCKLDEVKRVPRTI